MSLKQSAKDSVNERETPHDRDSPSWQHGRDCVCLRVDIRPDEVFIFPYQQFLGAHHVRTAADETLRITLSTHEVTLTGHRLEKLLAALQEFAVDWIRPLPTRYRDLSASTEPVITSIEVKALAE